MKRWGIILGLTGIACGGSEDGTPGGCNIFEDRNGTYLLRFSERSGNCGAIPDQLARLESDAPLQEGCILTADDTISDDGCTLERSYSCLIDGTESDWVAVTTQEDSSAETITGTITVSFDDGLQSCTSTYSVLATRQ